ncbi:hypothetical protein FGX01_01725, partial [Xylella fastidiosa subsp. multiplex]|nr:hypothetical protein [Xylella fastidiosa subsp. multiplex]
AAARHLPARVGRREHFGRGAGGRLGMLGTADIFETPFSTKAYTAELIRTQGARNVNYMVANDPSIRTSLSATSPLDQSSI